MGNVIASPPGTGARVERDTPRVDISLSDLGYSVLSTLEAPLGWSARVHAQKPVPASEREAHWFKETGLATRDSHFTLVIPIHNEAAGLKTFFGALTHSHLPHSVNAQIVFVTNACSDNSAAIVREALDQLARHYDHGEREANPTLREIADVQLRDSRVTEAPLFTALDRVRYVHIDTATRGKANALNIGNALALHAGHRVVISIDSDCCPEPAAIMTMFREMHAAIEADGSLPPVLCGMGSTEWNWGRDLPPLERARHAKVTIERDGNKNRPGMMGWLMAWDAPWLDRTGGVPEAVIEDLALGIQGIVHGGGRRVVDAKIWGYGPTNRKDHWDATARYSQGAFQIRERYANDPQLSKFVREETAWFASPLRVLHSLARDVWNGRIGPVAGAYRALQHTRAMALGWLHNRLDPDSQSWRQIGSTRLR